MKNYILFAVLISSLGACKNDPSKISDQKGLNERLVVLKNDNIIRYQDKTPFLWLGCTAWGMTEWLNREDVDYYLDDRKSKGFNVVQLCLFWGKRKDYPTVFTANAENPYGHKAFEEIDGIIDPLTPKVVEGGSPENPNDYWDHVDYCLKAIKEREMYAAVLPFWGRRYVNATHKNQSNQVFTTDNIKQYGEFLGKRYGNESHIIWVNGGDVKADQGGDYLQEYRLLAEGLILGVTNKDIKWNENSEYWDQLLITYHPDGTPMINSSTWFHQDPWLDFNMIETYIHQEFIVKSIQQDISKKPIKPTVMAEPNYEGYLDGKAASALDMRKQAWQTFFAGACGFTYGGSFGDEGNGPLFSPSNNWKPLLNMPGASQMIHLRNFLEKHEWWSWERVPEIILSGKSEGSFEKLAATYKDKMLIYFPDTSKCQLSLNNMMDYFWYNTATGEETEPKLNDDDKFHIPPRWEDGVLVIRMNKSS